MRMPRILIALGLALLGSGPPEEAGARPLEPGAAAERDAAAPERRGHLRRGPGYAVWEETRQEAERWAAELEACVPPERRGEG